MSHGDDVDLIVVGAGLAGLSAAVRAAQLGVRTLVLEQGTSADYPCNSRHSGGMFHLAARDVGVDGDQLFREIAADAPDDIDRDMLAALACRAAGSIAWLRKNAGVRFIRVGPKPQERWVLAPPRPPKSGLYWPGRGSDRMLTALVERLREAGGEVRLGHKVLDAERTGRGFRLICEVAEGTMTLNCSKLIWADGGFQANDTLLGEHVAPSPSKLLQRNARTSMGTSLSLAHKLGARLSKLDSFYGHLVAVDAMERADLWPYPITDSLALAGILVGPNGTCLGRMARSGVELANHVAKLSNMGPVSAIFDEHIWQSVGRQTRVPPNPILLDKGATIYSAAELADLAHLAGIDPATLRNSVSEHNAAVTNGEKSGAKHSKFAIIHPPFYAIAVAAGITYTMGGMQVNPQGQALAEVDGTVLDGLYAVGAAAGGIEGGQKNYYLGGLAKALITGLIAGEGVASELVAMPSNAFNSRAKG